MAKFEVSKSVEALKLNKRTGIPLTEPPTTIPYGAILDDLQETGEFYEFSYLTERYRMKRDSVKGALHPLGGPKETVASPAASVGEDSNVADTRPVLEFEPLRVRSGPALLRAKVPGGWLVTGAGGAVTFVSDEYHNWDGGSHV